MVVTETRKRDVSSVNDTDVLRRKKSEFSSKISEACYDLHVTSADDLPLSYRRRVEARLLND